jgi:hypothetical protein
MGDWDQAIAPLLEHPRCPLCDEGRMVEIIFPGPFYFCQVCANQWPAYLTARALSEMKRPES